ncbi:berberine bridge enzyme-like D-2 [Phragmites australis]|uniref:berberine bridge enzyme-like D-2 n=1 Tax=Phragmites australis TaxID=29695 RepID=UPI002D775CAB|nr:berberine bridge enzyme-like D-2 [Phragmites australis]
MMHTAVVAALVLCLFATEATCSSAQTPTHNISSCLLSNGVKNFSLPTDPSYMPLLDSSIRNLCFELPGVGKPAAVVLPASKRDLQRAILCARSSSLAIRVRSGGHSYGGLSYTTENHVPFVVIDLTNLNRVQVDSGSGTAWAESGATLGELYYVVGRSNRTLAFSAGSCSTVGMGGHTSGGGFGLLSRKFGLAADNVLDAILIDPSGNALTRESMDDDVFWAIRGGGGGSWGVVYAWKLRLVPVPSNITVFSLGRTGPVERIAELMHKWQYVGPNLPDEFYLSTYIASGSSNGNLSMSFTGQVLGPKHLAMSVLSRSFPELGLAESELSESSWLESAVKFADLDSVLNLTNRQPGVGQYSKRKSDYVQAPISMQDAIKIIQYLSTASQGSILLDPYGGAMARVGSTETPFPHRAGNLYSIQYAVSWKASDIDRADEYIGWLRSFYAFMAPYVSKDPRAAYVNYLDLDLGTNDWTNATGGTSNNSVSHAASWGQRYFLRNFDRLVQAKSKVDPENVFNNAQSIPPLHYERQH